MLNSAVAKRAFFPLTVHFSTMDSGAQQSTLSTDHDYSPHRASFCPQVLSDCLQLLSVHLSDCSLSLSTAKQKKKELSTSLCIKLWLTGGVQSGQQQGGSRIRGYLGLSPDICGCVWGRPLNSWNMMHFFLIFLWNKSFSITGAKTKKDSSNLLSRKPTWRSKVYSGVEKSETTLKIWVVSYIFKIWE